MGEAYTYSLRRALADQLRDTREAAGLTRDDLVERCRSDIKKRAIETYENGSRRIMVERLDELCDALGVDMIILLRLVRQRMENFNTRQLLFKDDG